MAEIISPSEDVSRRVDGSTSSKVPESCAVTVVVAVPAIVNLKVNDRLKVPLALRVTDPPIVATVTVSPFCVSVFEKGNGRPLTLSRL